MMIKCKHIINIANRCCCIRRKAGPGRRPIPIGFYPSPGGIETAVKSSKWPEHEGKLYPLSCHPSNRFRLFNIRPKSIRKESQRARKREREREREREFHLVHVSIFQHFHIRYQDCSIFKVCSDEMRRL